MKLSCSCGLDFEGGPGNCGAVPGPIPAPIPDGPSGTDTGGFSSVDELLEVDGIGEATLADLAPLVTL